MYGGDEDCESSNRFAVVDDKKIERLIKMSPGHAAPSIAKILFIWHMSVLRNLNRFGYVNRFNC